MRFSVALPTCMEGMIYPVPFASPEQLIQIAQRAEQLGYHSVWGNDHMSTQAYVREAYSQAPRFWEPLISYGYLAAETQTLRLGTGVLVAPLRRDVVVLAKQLATLDHLSDGRLLVGLGIGAYREEFQALHPDWSVRRGSMLEESLAALRQLFTESPVSFAGEYFSVSGVEMFPKPLQEPLPIYIGGNNPNAVRRTAEFGNGWMPAGMSLERLRSEILRLKSLLEERGRSPLEIDVAPQFVVHLAKSREAAVRSFRGSQAYHHLVSLRSSTLKDQAESAFEDANLIGSPAQVLEKVQALEEAGVTHLAGMLFAVNSVEQLLTQMQIFAEEVAPGRAVASRPA
jgi:probable F420-dependent oxidoreductase